ncbi:hypothetical protein RRG08_033183 [Elysia crispata]|uniref:Uncharacterized protein n=1 Tax=Elysia crispata TaxID=231223 RepID=A0AAE1BA10_9GAST|nr:hypothetical protein RRG08_033183 [Elysia crispata]
MSLEDAAAQNVWRLCKKPEGSSSYPRTNLHYNGTLSTFTSRGTSRIELLGGQYLGEKSLSREEFPPELRTDDVNYHLKSGTTQRCCLCGQKSKLLCTKCNVPVHAQCSKAFYSKTGYYCPLDRSVPTSTGRRLIHLTRGHKDLTLSIEFGSNQWLRWPTSLIFSRLAVMAAVSVGRVLTDAN